MAALPPNSATPPDELATTAACDNTAKKGVKRSCDADEHSPAKRLCEEHILVVYLPFQKAGKGPCAVLFTVVDPGHCAILDSQIPPGGRFLAANTDVGADLLSFVYDIKEDPYQKRYPTYIGEVLGELNCSEVEGQPDIDNFNWEITIIDIYSHTPPAQAPLPGCHFIGYKVVEYSDEERVRWIEIDYNTVARMRQTNCSRLYTSLNELTKELGLPSNPVVQKLPGGMALDMNRCSGMFIVSNAARTI